jgi:ABC-type transporter Mla subunit MlaD
MKKGPTALIAALLLAATLGIAADEKKETAEKQQQKKDSAEKAEKAKPDPNESPLVRAARESKAKREQSEKSRITITNKDVEKSGGKLIQTTTKPLEPLPSSKPTAEEMRQVAAENVRAERRADLQAQVAKHQKTVTELEKELRRIEETYYNEDDPDYREDVLSTSFDDTKKQLDEARKQLATARKALAAAGGN